MSLLYSGMDWLLKHPLDFTNFNNESRTLTTTRMSKLHSALFFLFLCLQCFPLMCCVLCIYNVFPNCCTFLLAFCMFACVFWSCRSQSLWGSVRNIGEGTTEQHKDEEQQETGCNLHMLSKVTNFTEPCWKRFALQIMVAHGRMENRQLLTDCQKNRSF